MCGWICLKKPKENVLGLLEYFFDQFSNITSQVISIEPINTHENDRSDFLNVFTSVQPFQNSTSNIGKSAFGIIKRELRQASRILKAIKMKSENWSSLFRKSDFVESYSNFILVRLKTAENNALITFKRLAPDLIKILDQNQFIELAQMSNDPITLNNDGYVTGLLIGVEFVEIEAVRNIQPECLLFMKRFRSIAKVSRIKKFNYMLNYISELAKQLFH
jgi:hypothetical protein